MLKEHQRAPVERECQRSNCRATGITDFLHPLPVVPTMLEGGEQNREFSSGKFCGTYFTESKMLHMLQNLWKQQKKTSNQDSGFAQVNCVLYGKISLS